SYKCICTYGYSGINCSENLNKSYCSSNPCINNGTCLQSPTSGDGICRCEQEVCLADSCVNVTGELYCLLHECKHGGKCDPIKRECLCEKGFTGIKCELNTIYCDQINNICLNNGTCLIKDNRCLCTNYFTGKYCEILI
ncbi:unnamed protein product, partial [Rotaria sordida]